MDVDFVSFACRGTVRGRAGDQRAKSLADQRRVEGPTKMTLPNRLQSKAGSAMRMAPAPRRRQTSCALASKESTRIACPPFRGEQARRLTRSGAARPQNQHRWRIRRSLLHRRATCHAPSAAAAAVVTLLGTISAGVLSWLFRIAAHPLLSHSTPRNDGMRPSSGPAACSTADPLASAGLRAVSGR